MNVYLNVSTHRRTTFTVYLEEPKLGKVKTEQIKRIAKELIRRFPDKFSIDFEKNKHAVDAFTHGTTIKVRNQIAGYITHFYSETQPEPSDENPNQDTKT